MTKTIFISYSWDSEEHKEWVLNLANNLIKNGIEVILDQYELSAGKDLTHFMEKSMTADKVLLVLTPDYKLKADNRTGGVGYEYSLVTKDFYNQHPDKTTIIPILRSGEKGTSCPIFVETRIFHDMSDDSKFDSGFFELIRIIIDKPKIMKPELGELPNFDSPKIPDLDQALINLKNKKSKIQEKQSLIYSSEGVSLFKETVKAILQRVNDSINHYQKNFQMPFWIDYDPNGFKIHFSTGNYTYYISVENIHERSANTAILHTNFFEGPVGFESKISRNLKKTGVIYRHTYKFDVNDDLAPIFIRMNSENIILQPEDISTVAIRDVVSREIKLQESNL